MKRSKAVEIIASWAKPEILQDVYSNNFEEWADNLLYTLETDLKMKGPSVLGYCKFDYQAIHGWDEENEKK